MGDKALSYHDILLRQEDLELLRGPNWLNDQVFVGIGGPLKFADFLQEIIFDRTFDISMGCCWAMFKFEHRRAAKCDSERLDTNIRAVPTGETARSISEIRSVDTARPALTRLSI